MPRWDSWRWGTAHPALAQAGSCTGGGKITKQIAKPMAAAQDAQKAKQWQEVLAQDSRSRSDAGAKTQTDLYWMNEFRGYAYHAARSVRRSRARTRSRAEHRPACRKPNKLERYKSLVGMYYALRNYPKAIDFGNRALKVGRDPESR